MDSMIPIFQVLIFIIFFIMFLLIGLYIYLLRPKAKKESEIVATDEVEGDEKDKDKKIENYGRFQGELTQESILDFMEFDEIVDNMIVRNM